MSGHAESASILSLTAQIVSAHLSNNRVETHALPDLIRSVHATLGGLSDAPAAVRRGTVLAAKGALLVDVGAESTLANAARVDGDAQLAQSGDLVVHQRDQRRNDNRGSGTA